MMKLLAVMASMLDIVYRNAVCTLGATANDAVLPEHDRILRTRRMLQARFPCMASFPKIRVPRKRAFCPIAEADQRFDCVENSAKCHITL